MAERFYIRRIPLGYIGLSLELSVYPVRVMDRVIREGFKTQRDQRRLTQPQVAAAGGLSQSRISRIETEEEYQPEVATFLRAVKGLGLTASEFFAFVEGRALRQTNADLSHTATSAITSTPLLANRTTQGVLRGSTRALPSGATETLRTLFAQIGNLCFEAEIQLRQHLEQTPTAPKAGPRRRRTS
ncbi:MAG: helix-turn-helix transcriptional regulator [Phycisphaerales bacterium]|jgi:transcriptional regulator with XRE-family HTH domain